MSEIIALTNIINENVAAIQRIFEGAGLAHPSINNTWNPANPAEQLTLNPEVLSAALLATSAASQLVATLRLPGMSLSDKAYTYHIPSALRIATESCIPEILREAGPGGMHATLIARKTKLDVGLISRTLRLLASNYVFREIEPDVFANNRLSSMIDTGKCVDDVLNVQAIRRRNQQTLARQLGDYEGDKYGDTNGISALVQQSSEEGFKASAFLPDVVLAGDYSKNAWQRAFGVDFSLWDSMKAQPGRMSRIQMTMVGYMSVRPQSRNFEGFDWASLDEGAIVIDVGGGNGSAMLDILQAAPHVKVIVQDREETIAHAAKAWWMNCPEKKTALESGQVTLQGQDFFAPQVPSVARSASIFHLRHVLHDWKTGDCVKILQQLHTDSAPSARLMLVEQIVPYACATPAELAFPGVRITDAPAPLLPNLGMARADVHFGDFSMAALCNGQERTIGEWKALTEESGWRIERVYQTLGSAISQIVCLKV